MSRAKRLSVAVSIAAGLWACGTHGASAASVNPVPPGWLTAPGGSNSTGVGFCLSQVAQNPDEIAGVPNLGTAISGLARNGSLAGQLDGSRYPVCGGPGSGA